MGDCRSLEPLRGRDLKKFRRREVLHDVGTANKERFIDRMNLVIDGMVVGTHCFCLVFWE